MSSSVNASPSPTAQEAAIISARGRASGSTAIAVHAGPQPRASSVGSCSYTPGLGSSRRHEAPTPPLPLGGWAEHPPWSPLGPDASAMGPWRDDGDSEVPALNPQGSGEEPHSAKNSSGTIGPGTGRGTGAGTARSSGWRGWSLGPQSGAPHPSQTQVPTQRVSLNVSAETEGGRVTRFQEASNRCSHNAAEVGDATKPEYLHWYPELGGDSVKQTRPSVLWPAQEDLAVGVVGCRPLPFERPPDAARVGRVLRAASEHSRLLQQGGPETVLRVLPGRKPPGGSLMPLCGAHDVLAARAEHTLRMRETQEAAVRQKGVLHAAHLKVASMYLPDSLDDLQVMQVRCGCGCMKALACSLDCAHNLRQCSSHSCQRAHRAVLTGGDGETGKQCARDAGAAGT
jgi:hypothetical protein